MEKRKIGTSVNLFYFTFYELKSFIFYLITIGVVGENNENK